jgi:hypothetical protein
LIWEEKRSGWVGAILLSLFVICIDFLAVLNLLNFLGIPAFTIAVFGEILYSSFVVFYLLQSHVRLKYNI